MLLMMMSLTLPPVMMILTIVSSRHKNRLTKENSSQPMLTSYYLSHSLLEFWFSGREKVSTTLMVIQVLVLR